MRLFIKLLGVLSLLLCIHFADFYMLDDRTRAKLKTEKVQTGRSKPLLSVNLALSGPKDDGRLLLSPLIEKGEYALAEEKAIVPPLLPGVESFAGYITVNKTCESNMFFWMFKAFEGDWQTKPLIIWLQGGPGVSSLVGLFREIGPYSLDAQGNLMKRKYSWCQKYNLMFIDNPVGTGFSYTKDKSGYANSESDVAEDLYEFIIQFYAMFSCLEKNPLYIMGESYAGKYIPAFSHYIYQRNKQNKNAGCIIPLAAVAIGNGLTDPLNMLHYGDYVFQLGMIDRRARDIIHEFEEEARKLIRAGEYSKAHQAWGNILGTIYDAAGVLSLYNYINDAVSVAGPEEAFLSKPETRRAIHVGNQPFVLTSEDVYDYLEMDLMRSVKPLIEDILKWEAFDFVVYSGQLDIICAYPLSENVYYKLKWQHADEYKKANRCLYKIDGKVVGYVKTAGVFTEIMFRNCGHLVPTNVPDVAFNFLDMFVTNRTGFRCG